MSKSWLVVLLGCLLCVGVVAVAAEEKKEEKKAKKEEKKEEKKPVMVPAAVAKAVNDCSKDAMVEECKEKKDGDKVSYEVNCKCKCVAGESFKMVVSAAGQVMEMSKHKEPSASLPPAVSAAVAKWAPGAKVSDTVKVETKKDSGTAYEVKAVLGGKELEAKIAADGKVLKADKLPEPKAEKKEEKKEKKEEKKA